MNKYQLIIVYLFTFNIGFCQVENCTWYFKSLTKNEKSSKFKYKRVNVSYFKNKQNFDKGKFNFISETEEYDDDFRLVKYIDYDSEKTITFSYKGDKLIEITENEKNKFYIINSKINYIDNNVVRINEYKIVKNNLEKCDSNIFSFYTIDNYSNYSKLIRLTPFENIGYSYDTIRVLFNNKKQKVAEIIETDTFKIFEYFDKLIIEKDNINHLENSYIYDTLNNLIEYSCKTEGKYLVEREENIYDLTGKLTKQICYNNKNKIKCILSYTYYDK